MGENPKEYLKKHIPRCLKSFQAIIKGEVVEHTPGPFWFTTYELRCPCSNTSFHMLGYPLSDLNPNAELGKMLVSPISAKCFLCDTLLHLLDTDIHGYHGELGCSAKYRGSGPQKLHCYSNCGETIFKDLTLNLVHDYNSFDADLSEAENTCEDLFRDFTLHGIFVSCLNNELITSLDL